MTFYEFVYKARGRMLRDFDKALGLRPVSDPYVSGDSFRALAGHKFDRDGSMDPARIAQGDIVFVDSHELPRFCKDVVPNIRHRFILVSHNADRNIDDSFLPLANDDRLFVWFAQNALLRHPKLHALPIGLENLRLHNNGITSDFDRLRSRPRAKAMRIMYAFSVNTNKAERAPALEAARSTAVADGPSWSVSRAYRKILSGYAFTLSPPGNGFDCHRTWEALYLGTIPIVKRAAFYDSFPGLPLLVVDDWREIAKWDEAFLRETYANIAPRIDSCPYLWMDYWSSEIAAKAASCRD